MKTKLLRSVIIICMLTVMLCGCTKKNETVIDTQTSEEKDADDGGMNAINPWHECSQKEAKDIVPRLFKAPEGATNISWSTMDAKDDAQPMVQMSFDLSGTSFNAREQLVSKEEITDISGMYYDWQAVDKVKLANWGEGNMTGEVHAFNGDDEDAQLILWFDIEIGAAYSLSATGPDLDGLDIQAVAEQMYDPSSEEDIPDSEDYDENEHVYLDISGCDTFTQIIDKKLTEGMGYVNTDIGDTNVLMVTSYVYDNNAGENDPFWAAIDAEIYYYDEDGSIRCMGYVTSGGTAYPLAIANGKLYVGNNHGMAKYIADPDLGLVLIDDEAWVEYDSDGKETYYHRSDTKGSLGDENGVVKDDSIMNSYFDEYFDADVLYFDKIVKN